MRARLSPRRDEIRSGLLLLLALVAAMWVLEAVNSVDHNALSADAGIRPRNVEHLWAILTAPFLHENFYPHLLDNTIPLVFMGVIIALRGARRLALVTLVVILISGLGTWLISPRGTDTFGASGLVFGYATYLLARGLFNRSLLEIAVGLIVGVIWGGVLVASLVPHAGVSWQDHVCGAVGGVLAAWLLSGTRGRARSGGRRPPADGGGGQQGRAPLGGRELHAALDRALEH
ncbi:MAG TPA: rhomboid family intramembrane serine protease [Solirubrobacteraceae bacterium]|nr:rhomboid family intramembrane serine protease [Solirubrobacteraceae bacterium]